ncbi:MAG: type II toxin-antitoxin system Phd/YefM family antitoxin [Cyanobacteria bacterium P01_H01_bin.105]
MNWQLVEAKSKLSEVLNRAHLEGPQVITKRGVPDAVVISVEDYAKLKPAGSFKDWLLNMPQASDTEEDDIFERSTGIARNIQL